MREGTIYRFPYVQDQVLMLQPLTDQQRLLLRCSATGGVHSFHLIGTGNWRAARALVARGLGEIEGRYFQATVAGAALVAEPEEE